MPPRLPAFDYLPPPFRPPCVSVPASSLDAHTQGHAAALNSVAWSCGGALLVCSSDHTVRIYEEAAKA